MLVGGDIDLLFGVTSVVQENFLIGVCLVQEQIGVIVQCYAYKNAITRDVAKPKMLLRPSEIAGSAPLHYPGEASHIQYIVVTFCCTGTRLGCA